ncbi:MAG: OmpH family outer membrane protein [Bdellovibrionota bacterium]
MSQARIQKKIAVGFAALASVFAFQAANAAELKIGYVDLQRAIQATTDGKKAKSDLEKEFNAKKTEFQKKEGDLKKMGEDLEKKKAAWSDDMRNRKGQEFQQEMMKFQKEVGESQLAISKKERELTAPILEKLSKAMEKVALDGGYDMVLERSEQSVLWAKKDLDLTDTIVKEFEKTKK